LDPLKELFDVWPESPAKYHIHVFIGLWKDEMSPNPLQMTDVLSDFQITVTLNTPSQSSFETLNTIEQNNILQLDGPEPDFLLDFKTKLVQCHWIELGTKVCFSKSHTIQLLKIVTGPCSSPFQE